MERTDQHGDMSGGNDGEIRHLYVHIPFCHRICPYCSFYKHEPGGTDTAAFLHSLTRELKAAEERWPGRVRPETVYFGGGTPTLLSTSHLQRWLPEFRSVLDFTNVREWTVEVNPRTIDERKAAVLLENGITRASLGVQAWDLPTLSVLGRDHAPEEAEEAFSILRRAGFPVVNIDLMFSVPGQSLETWRETLHRTISLQPDHVSAYNLTYEEDTAFFDKLTAGEYRRDETADGDCFSAAIEMLSEAGFIHYEISNYSRPGCESLHNQSYWAGEDYLGLGPGAVSTIDRTRWKNVSNTALYISDPCAGRETEHLTDAQWSCERIALELRTRKGVRLIHLPFPERLPDITAAGLAEVAQDCLRLTEKGKPLADTIAAHLWT
ncbi:MAG TPA: radical SAM family heme chaperone HemW [Verrucomicrobiales bacterium]|nr:radical SAM family heme chaperone HemW [Verrucomicrobiales bacterium]